MTSLIQAYFAPDTLIVVSEVELLYTYIQIVCLDPILTRCSGSITTELSYRGFTSYVNINIYSIYYFIVCYAICSIYYDIVFIFGILFTYIIIRTIILVLESLATLPFQVCLNQLLLQRPKYPL